MRKWMCKRQNVVVADSDGQFSQPRERTVIQVDINVRQHGVDVQKQGRTDPRGLPARAQHVARRV